MSLRIAHLNKTLLDMHNIVTGKNDDLPSVIARRKQLPIFEPLVHPNGISGKVVCNRTIEPSDYYSLLDVI